VSTLAFLILLNLCMSLFIAIIITIIAQRCSTLRVCTGGRVAVPAGRCCAAGMGQRVRAGPGDGGLGKAEGLHEHLRHKLQTESQKAKTGAAA